MDAHMEKQSQIARRAEREDIDVLESLKWSWALERGEPDLDRERHRDALTDWLLDHWTSHRAYVASINGNVVGVAWLAITDRIPGGSARECRVGDLQSMFVAPTARDRGLGSALVTRILDDARAEGLEYVSVRPSRRALPFYQRHGFGPDGLLITRPD